MQTMIGSNITNQNIKMNINSRNIEKNINNWNIEPIFFKSFTGLSTQTAASWTAVEIESSALDLSTLSLARTYANQEKVNVWKST